MLAALQTCDQRGHGRYTVKLKRCCVGAAKCHVKIRKERLCLKSILRMPLCFTKYVYVPSRGGREGLDLSQPVNDARIADVCFTHTQTSVACFVFTTLQRQ